jgi:serine/threonine-protein kinase RsbW
MDVPVTADRGDHTDHWSGSGGAGQRDRIEIDLPLSHRHASTVRAVAASLAADLGFSVDEIDDLRLGVNEAVSVLADVDPVEGARLHLTFAVDGIEGQSAVVVVTAARYGIDAQLTQADLDPLALRILSAVVDHFEIDPSGAVVVVKRVTGTTGTTGSGHAG